MYLKQCSHRTVFLLWRLASLVTSILKLPTVLLLLLPVQYRSLSSLYSNVLTVVLGHHLHEIVSIAGKSSQLTRQLMENSLITRQIMRVGKPLEWGICGPKEVVLQKISYVFERRSESSINSFRNHVRERAQTSEGNLPLKAQHKSEMGSPGSATAEFWWLWAATAFTTNTPDSAHFLWDFWRCWQISQTNELYPLNLHLQAQLWSKAFAPNSTNDGGGRSEPSSLFFWLDTPSCAKYRKVLLFLTAS